MKRDARARDDCVPSALEVARRLNAYPRFAHGGNPPARVASRAAADLPRLVLFAEARAFREIPKPLSSSFAI